MLLGIKVQAYELFRSFCTCISNPNHYAKPINIGLRKIMMIKKHKAAIWLQNARDI